ncbi:hypothetical protein HO173_002804 [Letharia columbiana]|uniref:Uncharacterized protein n=1 Tax=Letharia columbiana TaxID=112416 RepID=A0A8H6G1T1_9LECA|nr:uncharacterized protein HO173_002804 [Letharia columbiana]KAF6238932.1 hypothetical protein HO173_002804 [Letharia columbiana]
MATRALQGHLQTSLKPPPATTHSTATGIHKPCLNAMTSSGSLGGCTEIGIRSYWNLSRTVCGELKVGWMQGNTRVNDSHKGSLTRDEAWLHVAKRNGRDELARLGRRAVRWIGKAGCWVNKGDGKLRELGQNKSVPISVCRKV